MNCMHNAQQKHIVNVTTTTGYAHTISGLCLHSCFDLVYNAEFHELNTLVLSVCLQHPGHRTITFNFVTLVL